MGCTRPGCPVLHYFPTFSQTYVHQVSDAIQPSHPLLAHSPPAFSLSQHQSFSMTRHFTSSDKSVVASASASVLLINPEGLISFHINWFDLFAMQRTLKSLLQHHTLKASVLRCSAFFKVKLSHQYMRTEKMIALTRQTFITMCYLCLLIHWVSHRFFLPRSKFFFFFFLISWLQTPSIFVWEAQKTKSVTVSLVSPSICHEVMGLDAMILFLNVEF